MRRKALGASELAATKRKAPQTARGFTAWRARSAKTAQDRVSAPGGVSMASRNGDRASCAIFRGRFSPPFFGFHRTGFARQIGAWTPQCVIWALQKRRIVGRVDSRRAALLRSDNPVRGAEEVGIPGCGRSAAWDAADAWPPSPRRRTLCRCSGEFIRSRGRGAPEIRSARPTLRTPGSAAPPRPCRRGPGLWRRWPRGPRACRSWRWRAGRPTCRACSS
jgi:hypothetical protein